MIEIEKSNNINIVFDFYALSAFKQDKCRGK